VAFHSISYLKPRQQELLRVMRQSLRLAEENHVLGKNIVDKHIDAINVFVAARGRGINVYNSELFDAAQAVGKLNDAIDYCMALPKEFREKQVPWEEPVVGFRIQLQLLQREVKNDLRHVRPQLVQEMRSGR